MSLSEACDHSDPTRERGTLTRVRSITFSSRVRVSVPRSRVGLPLSQQEPSDSIILPFGDVDIHLEGHGFDEQVHHLLVIVQAVNRVSQDLFGDAGICHLAL